MKEILLAGCTDLTYSYEDEYGGVFTRHCVELINQSDLWTYNQFYKKIRESLPSSKYPQIPQLEGRAENKQRIIFYTEKQEPQPELTFWEKFFRWLFNWFNDD